MFQKYSNELGLLFNLQIFCDFNRSEFCFHPINMICDETYVQLKIMKTFRVDLIYVSVQIM